MKRHAPSAAATEPAMATVHSSEPKRKRRRKEARQEAGGENAKARAIASPPSEPPVSALENLPIELLWHIHVLSRCHKLPTLSRRLRSAFSRVPTGVKVDFLLASWFDAYKGDLIPPGCFARKTSAWCQGPFPPPQNWLNDPISTYERRKAGEPYLWVDSPHHVIDYCLAFPLCDEEVLSALHDVILHRRAHAFSNIIAALGCEEIPRGPTLLRVHSLPRRLLRTFVTREPNPSDPFFKTFRSLFGEAPFPRDLRFILRLVALHSPPHAALLKGDRYALPRATIERSTSFTRLLLGLGADPNWDNGMAVRVAIRAGWLEGVRLLIEAGDERRRAAAFLGFVRAALLEGAWPFHGGERGTPRRLSWPDDAPSWREDPSAPPFQGHSSLSAWLRAPSPLKRTKRPDRLSPTPDMLHDAVKGGAWDIVRYLRDEKGVAPKLQTLKLLGAG